MINGVHCDKVTTKVTPLCDLIVTLKRAIVEEKAAGGGGGTPCGLRMFRTYL